VQPQLSSLTLTLTLSLTATPTLNPTGVAVFVKANAVGVNDTIVNKV